MTLVVLVEDARGSRRFGPDAFPLALGGPGSEIEVAGVSAGDAVAWVGLERNDLFVQTVDGRRTVLCNGTPLDSSQWLHDGDEIVVGATRIGIEASSAEVRLRVTATVEDTITEPPTLVPSGGGGVDDAAADPSTVRPVDFRPRAIAGEARPRRRVRWLAVLSWLGLALLAGAAWFLFTLRSVEVEVQPEPDRLAFEGDWPVVMLGGRHVLRPGSYTVVAEKQGYRRLELPLRIDDDSGSTLRLALEKLPGFLVVDVGSLAGAEVLVDGESMGTTPLEPIELPAGEYSVRIRAARHSDFESTVTLEGLGRSETVTAELAGRWAAVTFRSSPAGATVRLAGKRIGVTPVTVDLMEGRHGYELALNGYKSHRDSVRVVAEEPRTLDAVPLVAADGTLRLTSDPEGATVTVNGEFEGLTPLELALVAQRPHDVKVSKAGFEPRSREIRLAADETAEMTVALEAKLGRLEIVAEPDDAQLRVNGEPAGNANRVLQLPAVPHTIEVQREGFEPYSARVTPRPGFPQSIHVTLQTAEQRERDSIPEVLRSPQGHEMVLIRGGRLRMGASRREPGRRANETLRDVELTRPYYLSTMEVSNRQFREFRREHLSGRAGQYNLEIDHHPAVRVTWKDAALFCNWLSKKDGLPPAYDELGGRVAAVRPMTTGYRLPSEAEWAWAARYPDGGDPLKYPWGPSLPAKPGSGNYGDESAAAVLANPISGYDDRYPTTAPVDSFAPNALGVFNLGGNVAEWIHDFYTIYPGGGPLETDPLGPGDGELHVIRGASWMDSSISELRLTYRDYGKDPRPDVGFRIARYAK